MSPVGLYGSLALILVAATVIGWAVNVATGRREWSWLGPALGLAVLVLLGSITVLLPGRAVTASVALAVALLASAVVLWRAGADARAVAAPGLAVVLVSLLATAVPFAAGGGLDVMGTYVNNDLAFHLYNAEWLRSHEGIEPNQITNAYPIGPHGLAVAVAGLTGADLTAVWNGLLIAVVVVTALASLKVLGSLRPVARTLGALLVGLSYLGAAFYVQSTFKETLMALFALGFALALREAVGEDPAPRGARRVGRLRTAIPPALFAAAGLATYSGPGLAWSVGTLGVWVVAAVALGEGRDWAIVRRKRWLIPAGVAGLLLGGAFVVSLWTRSADLIGGPEVTGEGALGNLFEPIPFYELFGVWPSNDFRVLDPVLLPAGGSHLPFFAALGALAVGCGLWRLARRRELVLLSALAAGAAVYLVSRYSLGPYVGSKGLAVIAPLTMLVALMGVAPQSATPGMLRGAGRAAPGNEPWRTALFVVFAVAALASTYVALAGARLDRDDHASQLAEFRPRVAGHNVLFLGSDEYVPWDLRGASVRSPVGTVPGLYPVNYVPGAARSGERVDFDTVPTGTLDEADFAITTNSDYGSEPPANFRPVDSTQSFTLWKRTEATPNRLTLVEGELPGEVLDCDTERGRRISRLDGHAHVFSTRPVIVPFGTPIEAGETAPLLVDEGKLATQTFRLPPGRWEISLQYHSLEPLLVDAPGLLDSELPPNSTRIGPYWPVGTIEMPHAGRVSVTVQPERRPLLRRLLGGPEVVRTGPQSVVGVLAATRAGEDREAVPLSQACGRLVDWLELDRMSDEQLERVTSLLYRGGRSGAP
jgi:hypothetical protein